jgi:selenide,water dikinase
VGRENFDDAGVFRLTDELAIIQTVDFFTPIVDGPFDFGRIAAVNSFSDVYAMGGRPVTAMNIVCFPKKGLDPQILKDILLGGLEIINQTGAVLVGGHSVDDDEIKYGLSITGIIHPEKVVTNAGARAGDRLILTKPIGTGILTTAIKAGFISKYAECDVIRWMTTLNKDACEAMQEVGVNACTDITGFGFLGHALEMAAASKVEMIIKSKDVAILPSVINMINMGMLPEGSMENLKYCTESVIIDSNISSFIVDCLSDAQTSGGLLISVSEDKAKELHNRLEERKCPHYEVGYVGEQSSGLIRVI